MPDIETKFTIDEWKSDYQSVFGDSPEELTSAQVLERVTSMYNDRETVREDESVTDDMQQNVAYWNNALTDTNTEHCNVDYLDEVYRQLLNIRDPPGPNQKTLFSLVHSFVVEMCSKLHFDQEVRLSSFRFRLGQRGLVDLQEIRVMYEDLVENRTCARHFENALLEALHVSKRSTKSEIIEAWNRGPCALLETFINENNLQSYREFVKLDLYCGMSSSGYGPGSIWPRIVEACDKISPLIPQIAERRRDYRGSDCWCCCLGRGSSRS